MNNDELKKKIADIIYHTGCTGACCECDYLKHSDADTYCKAMLKASALIAAGIGDVKEAERLKIELKQKVEYIHELWEAKEDYKHRAEVAERALYIAATQLKCRGGIGKGFCRVDECDYYHCDNDEGCVNAHLKQAEKEFWRGRKDD